MSIGILWPSELGVSVRSRLKSRRQVLITSEGVTFERPYLKTQTYPWADIEIVIAYGEVLGFKNFLRLLVDDYYYGALQMSLQIRNVAFNRHILLGRISRRVDKQQLKQELALLKGLPGSLEALHEHVGEAPFRAPSVALSHRRMYRNRFLLLMSMSSLLVLALLSGAFVFADDVPVIVQVGGGLVALATLAYLKVTVGAGLVADADGVVVRQSSGHNISLPWDQVAGFTTQPTINGYYVVVLTADGRELKTAALAVSLKNGRQTRRILGELEASRLAALRDT